MSRVSCQGVRFFLGVGGVNIHLNVFLEVVQFFWGMIHLKISILV